MRHRGIPGKGLGIAINDFDRDGWPDIFVANDSVAEQLFRNNHDGTFSEVALEAGLAYDQNGQAFAGMGADFADYDNDGWPDVFVNALANQKYALFRNDKGKFEDIIDSSGLGAVTMSHSGWGAKWIDYDNDGWLDLFVAQGHVMDNIELTEPSLRYLRSAAAAEKYRNSIPRRIVTERSGISNSHRRPRRRVRRPQQRRLYRRCHQLQ